MNITFMRRLRPSIRWAGLLFAAGLIFFILSSAGMAGENTPCPPLGKHNRNLETWSVHTKIDLPDHNKPIYLGLFFVSGKLYFFQGNLAHIFWMDTTSNTYTYESAFFIPPFAEVAHDDNRLNEKFRNSAIQYDKKKGLIHVTADFSKLHPRIGLHPEKDTIRFDEVFDKNKKDKLSDWYLLPRTQVEADIDGQTDGNGKATGIGHFQHYWGDDVYEGGDFIVAHMESGHDLIISNVADEYSHLPHMAGAYIMITTPKDDKQVIRSFEYAAVEWWTSEHSHKKYRVHVRVKSADPSISLDIQAFKTNQTATLLGVEKWFGYGSVKGTLQNTPLTGWAFMSMVGVKDEK